MRRLSHFAEIILDDLGICGSFDEGIVNKDIDAPLFQKTGNRKRAYGDAKTRPWGKPRVEEPVWRTQQEYCGRRPALEFQDWLR